MTFFTDSKCNIVTFDGIMTEQQKDILRKERLETSNYFIHVI